MQSLHQGVELVLCLFHVLFVLEFRHRCASAAALDCCLSKYTSLSPYPHTHFFPHLPPQLFGSRSYTPTIGAPYPSKYPDCCHLNNLCSSTDADVVSVLHRMHLQPHCRQAHILHSMTPCIMVSTKAYTAALTCCLCCSWLQLRQQLHPMLPLSLP